MLYRNCKKHYYVNTLRLELRLVRGSGLGYTRVNGASATDAVSFFRLVSLGFIAEVHTSTLRRCNDGNLGYTKRDNKRSPSERVRYTSGQLQFPTSNHGPRN